MKKLLFLLLIFVGLGAMAQPVSAPQIPNVSVQRLRSDAVNLSVQFTANSQPLDVSADVFRFNLIEPTTGLVRLTLNQGSGIAKTGNTVTIALTSQQVAALTKDSYQYRLFTVSPSGDLTRLYGVFWLVRGLLSGSTSATLSATTIVINYAANGTVNVSGGVGSGGGITTETDPTVPSLVKAIASTDLTNWNSAYRTPANVKAALESLTGTNRLDATAIKNLPSGGGGVVTETDPTVSEAAKAITASNIIAWNTAAASTANVIYQSNYAANLNDANMWVNGSSTFSRSGGQLIVSSVDDAVGFGDDTKYRPDQLIYVSVDFVKTGSDVVVSPCYGCSPTSSYTLTATGKYNFTLKRAYNYPIGGYNIVLFQPTGVGGAKSFTLNSLTITDGGSGFSDALPWVKIGAGAAGNYNSVVIGKSANYSANFLDGVAIGTNAKTDQQGGVVIGAEANGNLNTTFGVASGSDLVALGYKARAYGWRTTALGARAGAAGQSSTAIGAGAFAGMSHAVAIGRGAFVVTFPGFGTGGLYTGSVISSDGNQLYFGNGWAHRFNPHPVDDTEYGVNDDTFVPQNMPVVLHGRDAYDSRTTPSSFNIQGGNLALMAGRGTGSATGGKLQLFTAPAASGTGQNDKNPAVAAAEFDASTNTADGTRLWLLDISSNTLKRVKVAPADGSGRKILYIE